LLVGGLVGCAAPLERPCGPLFLEPGEVFSGLIACDAQIPWGADGLVGDLLLANHQGYAVLRVDSDALHFLHVGGGTLLDFSAWHVLDPIAEVVPMVDSAWIRGGVLQWGASVDTAWATVSGVLVPVPFLDGEATSEETVQFKLGAEDLVLQMEGADGQLFLGKAGGVFSDEGLWSNGELGVDLSPVEVDLGGAIVSQSTRLEWVPSKPVADQGGAVLDPEFWRPEGMMRVKFDRAFPSRDTRSTAVEVQEQAFEEGSALLILGALDEVGVPVVIDNSGLRVVGASEARAPGMGRVLVWPFSPKNHRPAHGAVPWEGLSAVDVLAVAKGGASDRLAMVDGDWLRAAGPTGEWNPFPDFFWVEDLDDFHFLRSIWQEGLPLALVGVVTWVPLEDSQLPSTAALHRPLLQGQSAVGNGPALFVHRKATADEAWDQVEVQLQVAVAGDVDQIHFWTAKSHLGEWAVPSDETNAFVPFFVPSHRDVWVSAEGKKWGLSSVQPASRKALPHLQGDFVRHPNTVFDGDAP